MANGQGKTKKTAPSLLKEVLDAEARKDIPFLTSEVRIPPQSFEAEQSVLGCFMLDQNAIIKVADFLRPKDFYKRAHQIIYAAMLELFDKSEPVDVLSAANRLKDAQALEEIGGRSYLANLVNTVPTATNVVHYAKTVQQKRIMRDLIEASHHIAQLGYQESEDIDSLLDDAEKKIFAISQHSITQEFLPVKTALEEAFERIEKLARNEGGTLRGVATGFVDLDHMLSGLQKSDFVVVAARPSLGKTSLVMDIARNVAREGVPVGIFSLEMSKEQLVDRLIAAEAHVDLWRLRTGRLKSSGDDNDFDHIRNALGVLSDAPLYIDDSPSVTALHIRTMSRRLKAEAGLGLIIVDYLLPAAYGVAYAQRKYGSASHGDIPRLEGLGAGA